MASSDFKDILLNNSNFAIERMHYNKNVNMSDSHFHKHYEILYIQSGQRNLSINNSLSYELSHLTIALLRPNVIHKTLSAKDSNQTRILINISQEFMNELINCSSPVIAHCFNTPILHLSAYDASMLNYFFTELLDNSPSSPLYNEKIKINIQKILLLLTDIYYNIHSESEAALNQTVTARVDYAIEYFQKNFSSSTVLTDAAKKLHISITYLERIFKKTMNTNLHKYLSAIRIINAKRLLESKTMSVSEIALACGFNNIVSFSRAFKRIEGYSPKEYQKSLFTKFIPEVKKNS